MGLLFADKYDNLQECIKVFYKDVIGFEPYVNNLQEDKMETQWSNIERLETLRNVLGSFNIEMYGELIEFLEETYSESNCGLEVGDIGFDIFTGLYDLLNEYLKKNKKNT